MKKNRIIAMLCWVQRCLYVDVSRHQKQPMKRKRLSQKRIQLRQKKTHIRGN